MLIPEKRELYPVNPPYMTILQRKGSKTLYKNIGRKVTMKVTKLAHSRAMGILVAEVYLTKNFTPFRIPHIILGTKTHELNSHLAVNVLDGEYDHLEDMICILDPTVSVEGMIGVELESKTKITLENQSQGQQMKKCNHSRRIENDETIHFFDNHLSNNVVNRPEVVDSVERVLPSVLRMQKQQEQEQQESERRKQERELVDKEDNNSDEDNKEDDPRYYRGELIMKGPRGGQYIIKDGKKIYVKSDANTSTSRSKSQKTSKSKKTFGSNVIYKVNFLQ
jgi:hypothetical protein